MVELKLFRDGAGNQIAVNPLNVNCVTLHSDGMVFIHFREGQHVVVQGTVVGVADFLKIEGRPHARDA